MKIVKTNLTQRKSTLITVLFALILLISMLLISGCQDKKTEQDLNKQQTQVQENPEETVIAVENFSTKNLTLLQETVLDIDGDNQPEKIELYTAAQRGADGKIMWDDGQRWVLLVRDSGKDFPLFDGYVQLGSLQFWAYTTGEKADFELTTIQTGSAAFMITKYTFVKEKQQFTKKIIYNPDDVNMQYTPVLDD
jgi:hypothetical protein